MKDIEKLMHICNKVLPLAYEDSLSYYETLCKISYTINDMVNVINNLPEYIKSVITTDELTNILSELLDTLREQIVIVNEKSNNATKDINEGQLLWINGLLYKATRNIYVGDKYVSGSNVIKTSIESQLSDIITSYNRLSNQLIDEINLLDNKIDNNIVYTPSNLTDSNTNIGLRTGIYNVPENMTLSGEVVIPQGAIININDGVTLTINGYINAGLYNIFSGGGNLIINNEVNTVGHPEWFNNDIAKTLKYFNVIELQSKDYFVHENLIIDKSNVKIFSHAPMTFLNEKTAKTRLLMLNKSSIVVGDENGTDIGAFPRNITFENIEIVSEYCTNPILIVYGVVDSLFKNIKINCSIANTCAVYCYKNIHTTYDNVYVHQSNATNVFYGFRCVDNNNPILAGGNASIYFEKCTVNNASMTDNIVYGWSIEGAFSDLFIDKCETYNCSVALNVNGTNKENGANDFIITNCVFDSCNIHAIEIKDISVSGMMTLDNTYVSKNNNNPNDSVVYIHDNSCTILMQNFEILSVNKNNIGLQISNTSALYFSGICNGMDTPTSVVGNSDNIKGYYFSNNTYKSF